MFFLKDNLVGGGGWGAGGSNMGVNIKITSQEEMQCAGTERVSICSAHHISSGKMIFMPTCLILCSFNGELLFIGYIRDNSESQAQMLQDFY